MVALVAVVARCRLLRRKIVVTAHNRAAHDGADRGATGLFRWFVREADLRVFLNSFDQDQTYFRVGDLVIPHGDYAAIASGSDVEGVGRDDTRVIVFGSLRPYKGIESLLDLASDLPGLTIDVTGRASDEAYARDLVSRAQDSANIDLNIRELSDAELAACIRRAALVVLPYPDLYNSGAALLALTLRRPLLLSDSPTARELQSEFGSALVRTYSAPLTAPDVSEAVAAARTIADDYPGTLTPRREWATIGRRYSAAFRGHPMEEVDHR
jgi:beta-1,4-mannosyltransferase